MLAVTAPSLTTATSLSAATFTVAFPGGPVFPFFVLTVCHYLSLNLIPSCK
jgi:hypothetical protein